MLNALIASAQFLIAFSKVNVRDVNALVALRVQELQEQENILRMIVLTAAKFAMS